MGTLDPGVVGLGLGGHWERLDVVGHEVRAPRSLASRRSCVIWRATAICPSVASRAFSERHPSRLLVGPESAIDVDIAVVLS